VLRHHNSGSYSRCTRQRLSLNPQYIECRLISKCFLMTAATVRQQFIENRMSESDEIERELEKLLRILCTCYVDGEQRASSSIHWDWDKEKNIKYMEWILLNSLMILIDLRH
jgi:hypothetical protein